MKRTNSLLLLIPLILFSFSCTNQEEIEKQVDKIDSLQTMLDHTKSVFEQVDSAQINKYLTQVRKQTKEFTSLDSVDKKSAVTISRYLYMRKTLERQYVHNYKDFKKDIKYSSEQLANLKKDVVNGKVDKTDFDKYISAEDSAIVELSSAVDYSMQGVMTAVLKYKELHEEIDHLLDSLKASQPTK